MSVSSGIDIFNKEGDTIGGARAMRRQARDLSGWMSILLTWFFFNFKNLKSSKIAEAGRHAGRRRQGVEGCVDIYLLLAWWWWWWWWWWCVDTKKDEKR